MRASNRLLLGLTVTIAIAGTVVSAHRLDEVLQAARIDLYPDRVTVDLDVTAGADVADSVIAAIDRDGDGVTSREEEHAYAAAIVGQLEIALDGARLQPQVISSSFPALETLRRGEGTIRVQVRARHQPLAFGRHHLLFRNGHLAHRSVYLANTLVPADSRLSVGQQRRTVDQRELTIDYVVRLKADTTFGPSLASFSASGFLLGLLATVLVVRYRQRNGA